MPDNAKQSEQELRLAVAMTGLGIVKVDYGTNTAIADALAGELFDLPVDETVSRDLFHSRFHPDDGPQVETLLHRSLDPSSEGILSLDMRVVHRDNTVRWLHIRKQIFFSTVDGQLQPNYSLTAAIDITKRKQDEEKIRQSHETFRRLVEDNPFGVYVIDADFKLSCFSEGSKRVFENVSPLHGADFGVMMRTIWPDPFASEAIARFRHTLETGEPYTAPRLVESRLDINEQESYEWMIRRIKLPDNRYGVVCYFYDASQQYRYEDALRESERRFRELADAAPAMLWITDVDHNCTFLSRSWYEFTGQTEEEGMGLGWTDATHPDDKEHAAREFVAASEARRLFMIQYRLRTASGRYRWALDVGQPRFDDDGEFVGFVGSVIDVHERYIAEQELRASEGRLRLAAETTGFGSYDLDLSSFENIWTDELYRIFDIPVGQPPDKDQLRSLVHEEDRSQYDEIISDAFSLNGPPRYQLEYRIVRSTGEIRWLLDTGRVFRQNEANDLKPNRIIGTVQDITEQKIFEQSLQRAKDAAESANRSRGEFLANMSHEIRTPMAAILGHADILRDHLRDPDNVQVVETIRRNGRFLLDIINDILDLSKIDADKMEIDRQFVQPTNLIADVRSLMDVRAAEKELQLKIEFSGPIPKLIQTDPVRLRQILLNLIGNAIKFTRSGDVKLVVSYHDDNTLEFSVVDTGIGIRSEALETLFDPFVQADSTSTRSFGGTGLGLTICKRLAQALGGDVSVISEYGVGSTFTLRIKAVTKGPLIQPNLNLSPKGREHVEEIQLSSTVLVVDDRRDIRYLAQHFIEKAGGTVVTATNGREAVEYFDATDRIDVDVIVMDMQMPEMDGYEATRELRRRGCTLPIIALTANAMKSDRQECLAAGCNDYTTKPLDRGKLIAMIDRLASTTSRGATSRPQT